MVNVTNLTKSMQKILHKVAQRKEIGLINVKNQANELFVNLYNKWQNIERKLKH